ncbi:MAG TPA: hypothetical protein VE621_03565 [Bryobacteraceae bacterium]|nr:hypothetical protein [Bryobacteraceae bacterium]
MRVVCCLLFGTLALAAAQNPPLKLVATIPLPNIEGRLGRPAADLTGQRVFVPATTANTLEIVNIASGRVSGSVKGLKGPLAVAYLPVKNRVFVANRDDGTIRIFDGKSFSQLASVNRTINADRLRVHLPTASVLGTYGTGGVVVMNADGKVTAELRMESHPEGLEPDRSSNRIFVNDLARKSIIVADRTTGAPMRTWPLSTASNNLEMAYDSAGQRLFVTGRRPPKLIIINTFSGVQMDERDTVRDPGDIYFDPNSKRVFVIGDGEIDVVRQVSPDRHEPMARETTRKGARTGLLVPEWNRLFVAAPKLGDEPAALLVYEVGR